MSDKDHAIIVKVIKEMGFQDFMTMLLGICTPGAIRDNIGHDNFEKFINFVRDIKEEI